MSKIRTKFWSYWYENVTKSTIVLIRFKVYFGSITVAIFVKSTRGFRRAHPQRVCPTVARLFCSRHIRHQKSGITGSLRLVSGPRRTCKWLSCTVQSTLGCTVRLKGVNFRSKGDTVIRRSKTPPSQRFCPKRGLIPEFFPFQGLLVLGEVWVWNSRKGPYKWSYSKHSRYYFSVRYFESKKD